MMTTRLTIAALVTLGLAAAPFAAAAKTYKPIRHHMLTTHHVHIRRHVSTMQSGAYGLSGMSTAQSRAYGPSGTSTAQSRTYGASGNPVGTVTAPSVGSYYWPSVGVTNTVPTWSNTSPPVRR